MREFSLKWVTDISLTAQEKLDHNNKIWAANCNVIFNGQDGFEIQEGKYGKKYMFM